MGYLFHAPGIFLSEHFILSPVSCHRDVKPGLVSFLQEESSRIVSGAGKGCLLGLDSDCSLLLKRGRGLWLFSVALDIRFCQRRTAGRDVKVSKVIGLLSKVKANRLQS